MEGTPTFGWMDRFIDGEDEVHIRTRKPMDPKDDAINALASETPNVPNEVDDSINELFTDENDATTALAPETPDVPDEVDNSIDELFDVENDATTSLAPNTQNDPDPISGDGGIDFQLGLEPDYQWDANFFEPGSLEFDYNPETIERFLCETEKGAQVSEQPRNAEISGNNIPQGQPGPLNAPAQSSAAPAELSKKRTASDSDNLHVEESRALQKKPRVDDTGSTSSIPQGNEAASTNSKKRRISDTVDSFQGSSELAPKRPRAAATGTSGRSNLRAGYAGFQQAQGSITVDPSAGTLPWALDRISEDHRARKTNQIASPASDPNILSKRNFEAPPRGFLAPVSQNTNESSPAVPPAQLNLPATDQHLWDQLDQYLAALGSDPTAVTQEGIQLASPGELPANSSDEAKSQENQVDNDNVIPLQGTVDGAALPEDGDALPDFDWDSNIASNMNGVDLPQFDLNQMLYPDPPELEYSIEVYDSSQSNPELGANASNIAPTAQSMAFASPAPPAVNLDLLVDPLLRDIGAQPGASNAPSGSNVPSGLSIRSGSGAQSGSGMPSGSNLPSGAPATPMWGPAPVLASTAVNNVPGRQRRAPNQAQHAGRRKGPYRHPDSTSNYKDPLSGRQTRKVEGYMEAHEPMPEGLTYEQIMRQFPNHVDGPLALEMYDRGVTFKEMASNSGTSTSHTKYSKRVEKLVRGMAHRDWDTTKHSNWSRDRKNIVFNILPQVYGVQRPADLRPYVSAPRVPEYETYERNLQQQSNYSAPQQQIQDPMQHQPFLQASPPIPPEQQAQASMQWQAPPQVQPGHNVEAAGPYQNFQQHAQPFLPNYCEQQPAQEGYTPPDQPLQHPTTGPRWDQLEHPQRGFQLDPAIMGMPSESGGYASSFDDSGIGLADEDSFQQDRPAETPLGDANWIKSQWGGMSKEQKLVAMDALFEGMGGNQQSNVLGEAILKGTKGKQRSSVEGLGILSAPNRTAPMNASSDRSNNQAYGQPTGSYHVGACEERNTQQYSAGKGTPAPNGPLGPTSTYHPGL